MRIIAGTARGRRIETPAGQQTRPTLDRVRENLFNILQTKTASSRVLDLFAGSGAFSMEALSRGAESAVLCDCDREASRIERKNAEALGFSDRIEQLHCDWRTAVQRLQREGRNFDIVFLDPPYRMTDLQEVFACLEPLIAEDGLVIAEHDVKKEILICGGYEKTDERKWGGCGMSFFRKIKRYDEGNDT